VKRNIKESVWKQIDKRGEDDCWEWMGYKNKDGYGRISIGRKLYSTHRLVYELMKGNILHNEVIMHLCNNPSCCNPKHLKCGTQEDNIYQMYEEGRDRHMIQEGELNNNSKLSNEKVIEIRKLYSSGNHSQRQIANQYNINQALVSGIINKKLWKHI